ncbi:MAG: sigma 54-interacting transcriptional regulator [Bacteroidota bacterium]
MSKSNSISDAISEAYRQATMLGGKAACWVQRDGSLCWVNPILGNMLGYKEEDAPDKIFELNPTINYLSWKKYWAELHNKGYVQNDSSLMTNTENVFTTRTSGMRVSHDGVEWCCLIFDDPNEKVKEKTVKELKESIENASARMMKYAVDHAHEMIMWIDKEGNFIYVNKRVLKKTGYSKKEFRKVKAWHLSEEVQSAEEWQAFFHKVKEQGKLAVETKQYRNDGGINYVDTLSTYTNYEGNEYIFSIVRDVTKKKERENLLLKMKYSFDNAREMICWFDETGRFLYVNDKMSEETGYTVEEILEKHLWDLAPRITPDTWINVWERFKKEGTVEPYVTHQKHRDGTIYPVEVSGSYLSHEGKEYLFAIARNITEKQVEQAKLRNAVAELEELKKQLEGERNYLQQEITISHNFNEIITQNKVYRKMLGLMQQVAETDATVLIQGETGTGKELIARAIHNMSSRHDRPMVKVNCASLPADLIESELFGHEKGAFTGAYQRKIGRFELANRGTLFLDEIGEMPIELQPKLLRALQEGEFERVGGTQTIKVDVRVITATNRDLEEMVAKGTFRQDLFYRVSVFPIQNMPLRERKDDIPILVKYFLRKYCNKMGRPMLKVTTANIERLQNYEFPGNVRELENLVERAIILSNKEILNLNAVLPAVEKRTAKNTKNLRNSFPSFEEVQREHIIEALNRTHWKVTGQNSASELLQINGKTLASKMKKLNIRREDFLSM